MSLDFSQMVETLNLGVLVLDAEGRIAYWNRSLASASGIETEAAVGRLLFELYPEIDRPSFRRDLKSVLSFGNFAYFSQKLHGHLLSMPPAPGSPPGFERMEQSCVMGPLREGGKIAYAYIVIEDVTESVDRERRLAELAMRDVLTSAYNRRFFDRRLVEELARSKRYGRPFSLIMLDIDHFKAVNDELGHQFGDRALCAAVEAWTSCLRSSDLVARYGGEEFCVLLPEVGQEESAALAERLRSSLASADVVLGGRSARITASAGLAFFRPEDESDDILHRADEALYRAKAAGRNRVEVSP
jgi:diguanylate cyclase (GGDEF)-like protein